MGCIVNGPGEAADADLAVCAAKNKALIYHKGKKVTTVAENQIVPTLLKLLKEKPPGRPRG
jgi:(E)-4-hydroxy-3-methylbut-2-enyl-diphosphate synthase